MLLGITFQLNNPVGLPFSYVFHCFSHWNCIFSRFISPALESLAADGLPLAPWIAGKWVREYPLGTNDTLAIVSHVHSNHGCYSYSWFYGYVKKSIWVVFLVVLLSIQPQLLTNRGNLGQNGPSSLVHHCQPADLVRRRGS